MTASVSTSGSVGAGQQQPTDSNSEVTVAGFIVKQLINLIDTAKIVQVTAVHPGAGSPPAAGTVDVQILVSQLDGAGNSTPSGIVYGLPYLRVQGGPWAVICDPAVGDIGPAVVCDRDISSVKAATAAGSSPQTTPGSYRKYSVSDGIYLGGCINKAPTSYLWVKTDGTFEIVDGLGNMIKSSSGGITITPAGALTVEGNLTVTGSFTAASVIGDGGSDSVGLQTHTHTSEAVGHPTSSPIPGT